MRVSGIIVSNTGQPVEGAVVMVVHGTRPFKDIAARTAGHGGFTLQLEPGEYEIKARHAALGTGSARVHVAEPGPAEVRIELG